MSQLAPIALFAYRRSAHLRRAVEALLLNPLARESDLHVFCDAPRKPEDECGVACVKQYVKTITGFKSVKIIYRENNLGLFKSVLNGVTSICNAEGKVIVLEDDLLVAPDFLRFMNDALSIYENEKSVYQISGYKFPVPSGPDDMALFLPIISCWGWATWKRAWDHFDASLEGLERIRAVSELRKRFNINETYDYFRMATDQRDGRIDSWGICWYLSVFVRDGLVLYPARSLVQNIGTDDSGTHGAGHAELQESLELAIYDSTKQRFPDQINYTSSNFRAVEDILRRVRPSFIRRLIYWVKSKKSLLKF